MPIMRSTLYLPTHLVKQATLYAPSRDPVDAVSYVLADYPKLVYVVRSWPLDNFGKVPAKVVSDLSIPQTSQLAEQSKGYSGSSVASSGMTVTVFEESSQTTRKGR